MCCSLRIMTRQGIEPRLLNIFQVLHQMSYLALQTQLKLPLFATSHDSNSRHVFRTVRTVRLPFSERRDLVVHKKTGPHGTVTYYIWHNATSLLELSAVLPGPLGTSSFHIWHDATQHRCEDAPHAIFPLASPSASLSPRRLPALMQAQALSNSKLVTTCKTPPAQHITDAALHPTFRVALDFSGSDVFPIRMLPFSFLCITICHSLQCFISSFLTLLLCRRACAGSGHVRRGGFCGHADAGQLAVLVVTTTATMAQ